MDKLKPCPFCRGEKVRWNSVWKRVDCMDCNAFFKMCNKSKEEHIFAWNKRAGRDLDEKEVWKVINKLDTLDIEDYEFRGENGDYTPNDKEKHLMVDYNEWCLNEVVEAICQTFSKPEIKLPEKKEQYIPTDEQVGRGAYYDLREIKGWNDCIDTIKQINNLTDEK